MAKITITRLPNATPEYDASQFDQMIKLLDQSYSDNVLIEFEPSNITNNHLQYAVTWFLLSFVIMIMYIYYIRQKVQKNEV